MTQCLNPCGDWLKYGDHKCLKVLEVVATEQESRDLCYSQDDHATLLMIDSLEEQNFLNTFLVKYNRISANVWLGLKYENSSYHWSDGQQRNVTNWSVYAQPDKQG